MDNITRLSAVVPMDNIMKQLSQAALLGLEGLGVSTPGLSAHNVLRHARAALSKHKAEGLNLLKQIKEAETNGRATAKQEARAEELTTICSEGQDAIEELERAIQAARTVGTPRRALAVRGPRLFSELFGDGAHDSLGFNSLGEFARIVFHGLADPRLMAASNNETGGDGSTAGYLIPPQYLGLLLDVSLETEIVRPRAEVIPMINREAGAAFWDTLDHSGNIGGLTMTWLAEGATSTDQQAKFRPIGLSARKGAIYCQASNEIVEDAQFDQTLTRAMIQSIGFGLDYAFVQGDGVGKPQGMLKDPALIVVPKENGQASGTIKYANVANIFGRLHPACMKNAVWLCNAATRAQLLQLFVTDGSVTAPQPVLQPDGMGGYVMMTLPVIFTEKVPTLGQQGDVSLVDFSQYLIGIRREAGMERSNGPGWFQDQTAFRTILRIDGRGKWSKPVTPKNGNTLSWCVTLGAR